MSPATPVRDVCGRYGIFTPAPELSRRFDVAVHAEVPVPRYNAAPGQTLPVVCSDDPSTVRTARWGLVPGWADDDARAHVNARAETLTERPAFREAARSRRCLVPADGFYEWRGDRGERRPYWVSVDDAPFAMAGLWTEWTPATRQTGLGDFGGDATAGDRDTDPVRTFCVVTTAPNDVVATLHDRMPAILSREAERRWLDPSTDPGALVGPYAGETSTRPVSTAVNDPSNDGPDLLAPVED